MRPIPGTLAMVFVLALGACAAPATQALETPTVQVTEAPPTTASAEKQAQPDQVPSTSARVSRVLAGESAARFYMDEVLRGEPKTVIGTTNQVQGEIIITSLEPLEAEVSAIEVSADSLSTDNSFRNRAIRTAILQTGSYPIIRFTPTAILDLPATGAVGEDYPFRIEGQLTIREVTQPVTFTVTLRPESETRLSGLATATVNRTDFDLRIPSVPQVANVGEEVRLEFEFVAEPE